MTHDPRADVDDVILAYLNAVDAGQTPDPADWLARYPHFADQLRPFFAVERHIGRVAALTPRHAPDETPGPGGRPDSFAEPCELGDRYEAGEQVGRGGMGDVVRVSDKLLGRVVAIKILQRRHRSHVGMAERFLDEARIAGRLQHPGVPSVHDIGTTPDGRPFLVMRLIEGDTLAERLRRRPDPSHDLPWFLKVFEQVAQTVAYAHSRGVLHRDLKPHNVMSGAFGEVQVMDWGLAKDLASRERQRPGSAQAPVAPGSPGAADERTQAGTVMGTPAYMAPEQARGETDRLDARADVFGLGAILCEILTGRPPFAGPDPLQQAKRGDVADALRRLGSASCDPELTELARRCLDPDPARRPADGQAVATAAVRHLAGVQERLRQTELAAAKAAAVRKQRRVIRGLGALAALLVVAGLASVLVVQARANANLTRKNSELAAANDRERQRFNLALDAIQFFHGEVSQDLILKEKQFVPLRVKLLRGAADFYGKLGAQAADQDNPATQSALARGYRQLGDVHHALGNEPEALAAYDKALAIQRRLAAMPGATHEATLDLATTLFRVGWALMDSRHSDVPPILAEAQSLAESVERDAGKTYTSQTLVVHVLNLRATVALRSEQFEDATARYAAALAILESLVTTHQTDTLVLHLLGEMHVQLGIVDPNMVAARRHMRQALDYYQARLLVEPHDVRARRDVAHCLVALAITNDDARIPGEEALAVVEAGRDRAVRLVAEYPFVSELRRVLALAHFVAGQRYLLAPGRLSDARSAFEAARGNWQQLSDGNNAVPTHRVYVARSRVMLAALDQKAGDPVAALEGLTLAAGELGALVRETDTDVNRAYLADTYRQIGLVHLAAGRVPEAAAATRQARDLLAPVLPKVGSYLPRQRIELAACHATLAELAGKPGADSPPADGPTEAARAMALLNANLSEYYPHPLVLTGDRGFNSLRDRPDFKRLIRDAPTPETSRAP